MKDVIVIGGGPSGLATASDLGEKGYEVTILERNDELGGLLQQCIHEGFGTMLFDKSLSGPEFADIFIERVDNVGVDVQLETYVRSVDKRLNHFEIETVTSEGVNKLRSKALVYAIGCRERNRFEIEIGGTRPAGVYTAGTVQRLVNMYGILPGKDVLIVGGGDVGMIVARHLYLEGVDSIMMVYPEEFFAGLPRNAQQCVLDFDIPYKPKTTVKTIYGDKKVEGVELVEVDDDWNMIEGTEERFDCDSVILSVGLVPYSEKLEELGADIDDKTKGPVVNEYFETSVDGVFSVGNLIQIFDYVDDAVKSSFIAAEGVDRYLSKYEEKKGSFIKFRTGDNVQTITPQTIDYDAEEEVTAFLRLSIEKENPEIIIRSSHGDMLKTYKKRYVRPSTLEKIKIPREILKDDKEVILDVQ
ncbi:MAG: NAD(P)/FAD-dependent oxidoreductase [Thermoplasmatota archaeon]